MSSYIENIIYNSATKRWEVKLNLTLANKTKFNIDISTSQGGIPFPVFGDGIIYNSIENTIDVPPGVSEFSFLLSFLEPQWTPFDVTVSIENESKTETLPPNVAELNVAIDPLPSLGGSDGAIYSTSSVGNQTGIAFNYSPYFERIVQALDKQNLNYTNLSSILVNLGFTVLSKINKIEKHQSSLATSTSSIEEHQSSLATSTSSIEEHQSSLATSTSSIEEHLNVIKNLAKGPGIRTLSPYETFSAIAIYKLFVEEGKILQFLEGEATNEEKAAALNKIVEYINKIKSEIPKDF